jgi:hypothetical protein
MVNAVVARGTDDPHLVTELIHEPQLSLVHLVRARLLLS